MRQNKLKLRYFASLREALGLADEEFERSECLLTVGDLRLRLSARGGEWLRLVAMKNLRCAVNQDMATDATPIDDGDEVAFFPPVTGG
jgi:molybdopterin synthase sulfur carrier subunit